MNSVYLDRGAYELRNPGFEAGTAGWNTSYSGAGVTLASAEGGHTGSGAAVVANTGSAKATCNLNDAPNWILLERAGTYTASLWVRADTPGATLKLRLREWTGDLAPSYPKTFVGQAKAAVTLTTDWQRVKVEYTARAPAAWSTGILSTLDFNAYVTGAPPGTCFYADDAAIALR
jgi:hypothetical protein